MKKVIAILGTAFLFAVLPAHAQKIDLSKMTCKQFIESSKENAAIMTWLSGFYTEEDEPAIVDFDKIRQGGEKLSDYCRRKPTAKLMDAASEVLDN